MFSTIGHNRASQRGSPVSEKTDNLPTYVKQNLQLFVSVAFQFRFKEKV